MFINSIAQPRVIDDLKQIFEDIGLRPDLPSDVQVSVEHALELIAEHKGSPQRFSDALDKAAEAVMATPVETFQVIREIHADSKPEFSLDDRERMYFASTMGQLETMDADKARAFVELNQESWRIWQESAKFWQVELS